MKEKLRCSILQYIIWRVVLCLDTSLVKLSCIPYFVEHGGTITGQITNGKCTCHLQGGLESPCKLLWSLGSDIWTRGANFQSYNFTV